MPDYNVQVIVPGSQATTVELPGIAGPPGPQGPVGPAGIPNTGILDLRYVTLSGNQTISGSKRFVQDDIIYTSNTFTDPYTNLIVDYSYINNLILKPIPEYRPVVSPNPNYLYTGIDGAIESQMYFDTGASRWKFYYGGLNPIHLVVESPIVKAGDPFTFAARLPMNGWTNSAGNQDTDFKLHYTTIHKSSHQIGGKDYLDPDTINAVAKTGNQIISGVKTFASRPTVNGTGVLLSGEAAGLPSTLVYTTGNQIISGAKTFERINFTAPEDNQIVGFISGKSSPGFTQSLTIQALGTEEPFLNLTAAGNTISIGEGTFSLYAPSGTNMAFGGPDSMSIQGTRELYANNITAYFKDINANNIYAQTGDFNGLDLNNVDNLLISGIDIYVENGNVSLTNTPTVRGNPVLTGVDLTQYATISNLNLTGANLNNKINTLSGVSVLTYGAQNIYGNKTFYDNIFINNLTVTGTQTIANVINTNIESNYLLLNITGGAIAGGIFFITGTQGSGLGPIMGYDLSNNKFKIGTGSRDGGITTLDNIATENFVNTNAVLISDNQIISGNKSFYGDVLLSGGNNRIGNSHYIQTDNNFVFIRNQNDTLIFGTEEYGLYDANGQITVAFNDRVLSGIDAASIYWGERYLANQLGQPVLYWTGDNIGIGTNNPSEKLEVVGNILGNNLVYNTGNQIINGTKTFTETGSFNTLEITNKKLSSYNYLNSNFTFDNIYINIVNSSNNVIGTLPSAITSGINYYVKNLNNGILLITGSSQRTIDGFSTVNLYKNESLQLLGVNNIGYTGWVTLSADNGVS